MKQRCSRAIAALFLTLTVLVTVFSARPVYAAEYSSEQLKVMNEVYDFLTTELNYNTAAACGILANIEKECIYVNYNTGDGAYGLMQWTGGRKEALIEFCEANGYGYDTVQGQLQYVKNEMQSDKDAYIKINNYMRNVKDSASGAYDAAHYWCYYYERPNNKESHSKTRGKLAKTVLYPMFHKDRGVFAAVTNPDPAAAPVMSSAQNTADGILVSWEPVDGAEQYILYRQDGKTWKKLATVGEAQYLDTTAVLGKNYDYTAQSVINSQYSRYDFTGVQETRLVPPTLKSASNTADGVALSWSKAGSAKKFRVLRKTGDSDWETVKELGSSKYTWTDTTAQSGVIYTYAIQSVSSIDASAPSNNCTIARLSQPKLSTLVGQPTGLELTWEAVEGAEGYRIYEKSGKNWVKVADISAEEPRWFYPFEGSGIDKTYTVAALIGDHTSSTSKNGLSLTYLKAPVLNSIQNTAKGIQLSWSAVSKASSYYIYRKTEGSTEWTQIRSVGSPSTSTTDTKVESGTTYTYTVCAVKKKSISAKDETGLTIRCLKAPQMLPVTNTDDQFVIAWNPVNGADTYRIYRKATPAAAWNEVGSVSGSETSWADPSIAPGETFYYTVAAICSGSLSPMASPYTNGTRLTTPELVSATNASTGIRVEWKQVPGAKGYQIYRSSDSSGWKLAGSANSTSITWIDKKAASGETYRYTVRAYSKTSGVQCFSKSAPNEVTATRIPTVKVSAPKALSGEPGFSIKWTLNKKVTGYEIQYSPNMDMSGAISTEVMVPSTSCKITGLTPGKKYYIRIRSFVRNDSGTTTSIWKTGSVNVK